MLGPQLLCLLFIVIFLSLHPEFSAFNLVLLFISTKTHPSAKSEKLFWCLLSDQCQFLHYRIAPDDDGVICGRSNKKEEDGSW